MERSKSERDAFEFAELVHHLLENELVDMYTVAELVSQQERAEDDNINAPDDQNRT